jgi:hypothetical protein
MLSAIWTTLLGVVGGFLAWLVTNFLGEPVRDFLTLRTRVQREITFTGNVGPMTKHLPEYDKAIEALCCLGAEIKVTKITAQWPLRLFAWLYG